MRLDYSRNLSNIYGDESPRASHAYAHTHITFEVIDRIRDPRESQTGGRAILIRIAQRESRIVRCQRAVVRACRQ